MAKMQRKIKSRVRKAARVIRKEAAKPEYKSWWKRQSTAAKILFIVLGAFVALMLISIVINIAVMAIPLIVIGLLAWLIVWLIKGKRGR